MYDKVADGFMARRHRVEVGKSWLRHANGDAKKKGDKDGGGGGGADVLIPLSIKAEKHW